MMKLIWLSIYLLLAGPALSEEKRIYQSDRYGNTEYNKPSFTVEGNGRVIETDPYGNKMYNHQQYQIKGDKVYQTDSIGNIQYQKPSLSIKK